MKNPARLFFDLPARKLLVIAAILQLTVVLSLFAMGRLGLVPNTIDDHGLLRVAVPDARDYDRDATKAVEILKQYGVHVWFASYDAHLKFYSLCYLVFGPLLGNNILSAEPFNLGCYLAILILVFKIGEELFDQAAARAAAAAVAIWPSFLLHNTQILKDPICIAAMLTLVLVITMWLTRELSWRMGLVTGLLGATAISLIYATRAAFWGLVLLGMILIGAAFLIFRNVRERSFPIGNILSVLVVLLPALAGIFLNAASLTPKDQVAFPAETANIAPANQNSAVITLDQPMNQSPAKGNNIQSEATPAVQSDKAPQDLSSTYPHKRNRLIALIQGMRDAFTDKYKDSATLIDSDAQFITTMDLVRYLPRAMAIGFLAPFPNTWLGKGRQVGLAGRLLAGAEMLAAYVLELFALFGVWRARQRLSTWVLLCVILFGVTTLGLGIINVGALYRLRYGFFVLLIVLGMYGLSQIVPGIRDRSIAGERRPDLNKATALATKSL